MFSRRNLLVACWGSLIVGCTDPSSGPQEIIDNLLEAGYSANDIAIVDGEVYVGNDALVTLQASREMLQPRHPSEEQYATNNLVSLLLARICINAPEFTGVFGTGLDLAIENYNALGLSFRLSRADNPPPEGCQFTIQAVIQPDLIGGQAGFPSNRQPFGQIIIGGGLGNFSVDTIEHVITHEIGHCFGFRHTDYFNRSISCGAGGNEGAAGVGANHIPGTPTGAVVGGSVMNACFRASETGEFTDGDVTSLNLMY